MKLVRAAFNTQAVRKFSSLRDIFEKPNIIPAKREKFYSNEAVGKKEQINCSMHELLCLMLSTCDN